MGMIDGLDYMRDDVWRKLSAGMFEKPLCSEKLYR
jgi:hypothetical protein